MTPLWMTRGFSKVHEVEGDASPSTSPRPLAEGTRKLSGMCPV